MKRQTRVGLSVLAAGTAALLYPCFAAAQIALPTASAVPGQSAEIPFELFRGSRIVLKGLVNGVETPMMLDSGAGVTTLDDDFAKRIGLSGGSPVTAQGVGGREQGRLVRDVTLQAGNLKLSGATVLVLDLERIEKVIGRPMPVVLGREVFISSVVSLDFDRRLLTLTPSKSFAPAAGATEVKLRRDGTLHYLPLSIDGFAPVEAALDLGNGGALSVSKEYADANPKLSALPYAIGMSGGVGGLHESRRITLPEVKIGGYALTDVPADLGSVEKGPYGGRVNAGIQLFKPFHVALDLGHDRMWLQRTTAAIDFPKDRSGILVELEKDHLNVLHVSPGSPAEKAGLKKGDRLIAIQGQEVEKGFYDSPQADWAKAAAGTEVAVTKGDGRTVKLVLADYY